MASRSSSGGTGVPEAPVLIGLGGAFAIGFAAAWWIWARPLGVVAAECRRRRSTDLSRALPETGPRSLLTLARTFNDLQVDFQEVLLLFAHLARSARVSADLLRPLASASTEAEGDRVREVLADVEEMQDTIRDFSYFRVALDGGLIRDTRSTRDASSGPNRTASGEHR
jgi:hypothetical protein